MSLLTNWLESLSYELEISESCTRKVSPLSTCSACTDECPDDAILFEDGKILIDDKRCSSCGVCITVCPVQSVKGQSPSRMVKQNYLLLEQQSPLPSMMEMLYYHKKGIRFIHQPSLTMDLVDRINQVNEILGEMQLERLHVTNRIVLKEKEQPRLSRRDFFTKLSLDSKKTVLSSVTPVKWRFNESYFKPSVLFKDWSFYQVKISEDECTLCEGCFHVCPPGIFSLGVSELILNENQCTGCNLCMDICKTNAIIVEMKVHQAPPVSYNLHKNVCTQCGSGFLAWEESDSCHICRTTEKPDFFL
ncbi:4Fe-4S dicluster domain-containing protein [Mesobacillus sp. LC4]